jgi:hypothetical protein
MGTAFWFMNELFVAPLHWGFVFFGWMALGVFGAVLQLLLNVHRLLGKEGVAGVAPLTGAKLPSDRPKHFKQCIENHSKVL